MAVILASSDAIISCMQEVARRRELPIPTIAITLEETAERDFPYLVKVLHVPTGDPREMYVNQAEVRQTEESAWYIARGLRDVYGAKAIVLREEANAKGTLPRRYVVYDPITRKPSRLEGETEDIMAAYSPC